MKLCYNVAEIEKAFGTRDISKLTRKQITDKNGHRKTVYVRNGEDEKKNQGGGQSENIGVAAVARGDVVQFKSGEKMIEGVVFGKGKLGVIIDGRGEAQGIRYKVNYADVKKIEKPANAADKVRFLMDKNAIKAGWRGTDGYQPESCDTIDGLLSTIGAVRGEFSNITEGVKKQFASLNPLLMKRKTLKSVDRIKEKLREDEKAYKKGCEKTGTKYEPQGYDEKTDTYHCRTIRDCDGHTLCMKSIDDVETFAAF